MYDNIMLLSLRAVISDEIVGARTGLDGLVDRDLEAAGGWSVLGRIYRVHSRTTPVLPLAGSRQTRMFIPAPGHSNRQIAHDGFRPAPIEEREDRR